MQPYKWHQMGQPFSARKLLGVPSEATHLAQDFPVPTSAITVWINLGGIWCICNISIVHQGSKELRWQSIINHCHGNIQRPRTKKTLPKINGPQNCENSLAGITGSCLSLCNDWIPTPLLIKTSWCVWHYIYMLLAKKHFFMGSISLSISSRFPQSVLSLLLSLVSAVPYSTSNTWI